MRLTPGDLFAIDTPAGTGYLQYVLKDPLMGPLMRALEGLYREEPAQTALAAVAARPERFWFFFPLGSALHHHIVRRAGRAPLPPGAETAPPMRSPGHIDREGRVHGWAIVDGDRTEWVTELTEGRHPGQIEPLPVSEHRGHARRSRSAVTVSTGLADAVAVPVEDVARGVAASTDARQPSEGVPDERAGAVGEERAGVFSLRSGASRESVGRRPAATRLG